MKKTDILNLFSGTKRLTKLLLIMKYSLLLLIAGMLKVSASVYSQTGFVTFNSKSLTMREAIRTVENQTDLRFFYNDVFTNIDQRIELKSNRMQAKEFLESLLNNTDLTYKIMEDNLVVISPKTLIQQNYITGKITDGSNGEPLPGVNIYIEGTLRGVISGINGEYSIEVPDKNAVLVYSFVGYSSIREAINGRTSIDISLIPDIAKLDEVVVIGYGMVKKSDLTGAISTMKVEEMSKAATASVTQMIQGKASGVMVQQLSAQPGGGLKIQIRGESTINSGKEPLFIIDGFPVFNEGVDPGGASHYNSGNRNPLNSINPNDIESIEILKDAASTSIYGARAANGVVLITTKKGNKGIHVSYDGRYSVQTMDTYVERLNAIEYAEYYNKYLYESMLYNNNMYPYGPNEPNENLFRWVYPQEYIDTVGVGTDWLGEISRLGRINDQNLSISGGNENINYYTSFGYYDQLGIIESTAFKRYSGRLNLDAKLSEKIRYGIRFTGSQSSNLNGTLGGEWSQAGQLAHALSFPATIPVYREDGSYTDYSDEPYQFINSLQHNPVSYNDISDKTITERLLANTYLEVELLKGLIFRPSIGFDRVSAKRDSYIPKSVKTGLDKGGIAAIGQGNNFSTMMDAVLTYNKIFNNAHYLTAMTGYSYQIFAKNGFNNSASGFFTDNLQTNNIGLANQATYKIGSYRDETKLASVFGRVNYNYNGKYLISASIRADGSDKFGSENKWGYFPGVSAGWAIHKEDFLMDIKKISQLKIRFSAGQSGNASFYGNAFSMYSPNALYSYDGNQVTGVTKTQLENPYLTWETTTELNYGLDFGFFKNRIHGSFEYFNKKISGLLEQQRMQIYHEVSRVWQNAGTTQTHGYELHLSGYPVDGSLMWKVDLNFSRYVSKWDERSPDNLIAMPPYEKMDDFMRPLYLYEVERILLPDEEIPTWMPGIRPGEV
ncbi:MAG: SusC/RagA family TonB-linked outer membrane protein, partial [Bacteroidales bacterium]|nr:SusC/RagA family TonB-linked outer membrane protein [Bacteroidales bacterium]